MPCHSVNCFLLGFTVLKKKGAVMQRRDRPFEALDAGAVVIIKGWRLCDRCNQAAANQEHLLIVEALQTMVTLFSTSNLLYSRRRLLVLQLCTCDKFIDFTRSPAEAEAEAQPSYLRARPCSGNKCQIKSTLDLCSAVGAGFVVGIWEYKDSA
jgi:hypothetical protein